MAYASQELVLGRVQLEQPGVLALDLAEELGVAQGHPDLAREQIEQILVGALPAARRRQVAGEDSHGLAAGTYVRSNRARVAGDRFLQGHRGRVDER